MGYTTSYSGDSSSSTENEFTQDTSSSTQNGTTVSDDSSSSSLTVSTTTQTSTPDDSDGLYATLGGDAVAVGEDTLTDGSLSGQLVDSGTVTTLDGSATMVAASESPDGDAFALADTYYDVSDGAELVFTSTVETNSTQQGTTGSSATSTSTTNVTAYDIDTSGTWGGGTGDGDTGDGGSGDGGTGGSSEPEDSTSSPTDPSGSFDFDDDLDGNFAALEFDAQVAGENTVLEVDGSVFVLEDEFSMTSGTLNMAVD